MQEFGEIMLLFDHLVDPDSEKMFGCCMKSHILHVISVLCALHQYPYPHFV